MSTTAKNIKYVLDIRLHLIFIGILDDKGYLAILMKKIEAHQKFSSGSKKKEIKHTLHDTDKIMQDRDIAKDSSNELRHKWLGHMSEKGIDIVARKKLLAIKGKALKTYTDCLTDK